MQAEKLRTALHLLQWMIQSGLLLFHLTTAAMEVNRQWMDGNCCSESGGRYSQPFGLTLSSELANSP